MFICPKCKNNLPCSCGYQVEYKDGIIQLTDLPNMRIDTNEDNYIGYEHIGKYYLGYDGTVKISEEETIIAQKIKAEISDGILLDLGCGDGQYTIPLLSVGVSVIGGDISNGMMKILSEKAESLKLDWSKLTLCRMNAYDIPLPDNSINAVIANSMLHLNSNPEKIVNEIYRVLKTGGKYLCFDDISNKWQDKDITPESIKCNERENEFHKCYFEYLSKMGIYARRYSWNFDRDAACKKIFDKSSSVIIELPYKKITSSFMAFYNRMKGRGFSDQSAVPDDIHKTIFDMVDKEMVEKYGDDYIDCYRTSYQDDVIMTVYVK